MASGETGLSSIVKWSHSLTERTLSYEDRNNCSIQFETTMGCWFKCMIFPMLCIPTKNNRCCSSLIKREVRHEKFVSHAGIICMDISVGDLQEQQGVWFESFPHTPKSLYDGIGRRVRLKI